MFDDDGGDSRDGPRVTSNMDARADQLAPQPRGLVASEVVTGDAHSCALDPAGDVYCWGSNEYGQLGLPLDVAAFSVPQLVELPTGVRAIGLAAGSQHTCAVTDRKTLFCWGRNDVGQLGRPASSFAAPDVVVPPPVLATAAFVAVAAGRAHTCAIYIQPQVADAGSGDAAPPEDILRLSCWGDNSSLQLGRDEVAFSGLPADVRRGPSAVVAAGMALGSDFSVASLRVADGYRVQAWGQAARGQLATDPDAGARFTPTTVLAEGGGTLDDAVDLAAGAAHACAALRVAFTPDASATPGDAEAPDADTGDLDAAVNEDGGDVADAAPSTELRIFCWGQNDRGQLARDAASPYERPALAAGAQGRASTLVLGGHVTCVLDDGELRCAGANEHGQLGLGVADDEPHGLFLPVRGLDWSIVRASLGARHACALLQTPIPGIAQVACWGDNSQGQLGDGLALGAGYVDAAPADRYRRALPVFVVPAD